MTELSRRCYYSGRVQGVGFRARTLRIAEGFPVSGYVRNLKDGRVEVLVQGNLPAVEGFLNSVQEFLQAYIAAVETEDAPWEKRVGFLIVS